MRGCWTPCLQQGCTEEPEKNTSVPQQEEQTAFAEGKDVTDYDQDVDYKPDESNSEIKAVNEGAENSDTEYVKMELSQDK